MKILPYLGTVRQPFVVAIVSTLGIASWITRLTPGRLFYCIPLYLSTIAILLLLLFFLSLEKKDKRVAVASKRYIIIRITRSRYYYNIQLQLILKEGKYSRK
jgi:hypothetical protein